LTKLVIAIACNPNIELVDVWENITVDYTVIIQYVVPTYNPAHDLHCQAKPPGCQAL
jgi:hypothetical protein